MIVLGVDPGSLRTGYGVIKTDGRTHRLVEAGVIAPPRSVGLAERLHRIHSSVAEVLARVEAQVLAVEDIFHATNARSAIVLGQVRGVVLLAGAQAGIPVHSFPPATVKSQIAGFGRADKVQVALMVAQILGLPRPEQAGDSTDALAVALCYAVQGLAALRLAELSSRARRAASA
jgi:crossover junction endodeoxyribonuclease RuvC